MVNRNAARLMSFEFVSQPQVVTNCSVRYCPIRAEIQTEGEGCEKLGGIHHINIKG